jgi:glycosyltransferase involved in cell wall biosynthesis
VVVLAVSTTPLVSVCMPAYNASRWIREALESATAQTYTNLEIIVADNASTDDTVAIAESISDPRIRIEHSSHTISPVANHNRVIAESHGEFVKLLHADDLLMPNCVERMVELAGEDEQIGLVFAPREVLMEDAPDPDWKERFLNPHEGFGMLEPINDGRDLFRRLLAAGFEGNWVGEPSGVLVRRSALEKVGLLNERVRLITDLELWARIMLGHRVGFVDEILSVFRHHGASGTVQNERRRRDWFDLPWLIESLLVSDGLTPGERSQLLQLRRSVLRWVRGAQLRRIRRGDPTDELPKYVAYRLRAAVGKPPPLTPPLAPRSG